MTWSSADILVVVVFVLQVGALAGLVLALRSLRSGARRIAARPTSLAAAATRLGRDATELAGRSGVRLAHLRGHVAAIRAAVRLDDPAGFVITPRTLSQSVGYGKVLATILRGARRDAEPAAKPRPPRAVGIAQRLGLVPPILSRSTWLVRAGRVAWAVLRQMRGAPGARRSP